MDPTSSSSPPPEFRPINTPRGLTAAVVAIVLWVLAVIFVGLRLLARRKSGNTGADDWTILSSLIPALGLCTSTVVWAAYGGLGWHTTELSMVQSQKSLEIFYSVEWFYTFTITIIKLSILLLYKRIFEHPKFRIAVYVVGALVICWFTSTLLVVIFQCTPVEAAWNPPMAEHCINAKAFFLGNGIASMLQDVIILCLPLPMIWGLQLDIRRKLALTGMFLLGSFVCVTSIIRITTLEGTDRADFSYSQGESEMWSCVEPCVGIICACLPTLGPLFKSIVQSHFSSAYHRSSSAEAIRPKQGYSDLESSRRGGRRKNKDGVAMDTIDMATADPSEFEMDHYSGLR